MDPGVELMIFMGLILKIPVLAACWLIWHAVRAEPDPAEATDSDGGGNQRNHFRRVRKRPPPGPRRGPHTPDSMPLPCPVEDDGLRVTRAPSRLREHQA